MKYCNICRKDTDHDEGGCIPCRDASISVNDICEHMGVVRQAVYSKSDRKGFGKRFKRPEDGGKSYRVFTQEEFDILVGEDLRYKEQRDAHMKKKELASL